MWIVMYGILGHFKGNSELLKYKYQSSYLILTNKVVGNELVILTQASNG
jgi:hypothetical protein